MDTMRPLSLIFVVIVKSPRSVQAYDVPLIYVEPAAELEVAGYTLYQSFRLP